MDHSNIVIKNEIDIIQHAMKQKTIAILIPYVILNDIKLKNIIYVPSIRGKWSRTMGCTMNNGMLFLFPEETLYLLKINMIFLFHGKIRNKVMTEETERNPLNVINKKRKCNMMDNMDSSNTNKIYNQHGLVTDYELDVSYYEPTDRVYDFLEYYHTVINVSLSIETYLAYVKLKNLDYIVTRHVLLPELLMLLANKNTTSLNEPLDIDSKVEYIELPQDYCEVLHTYEGIHSSCETLQHKILHNFISFDIYMNVASWSKSACHSGALTPTALVVVTTNMKIPPIDVLNPLLKACTNRYSQNKSQYKHPPIGLYLTVVAKSNIITEMVMPTIERCIEYDIDAKVTPSPTTSMLPHTLLPGIKSIQNHQKTNPTSRHDGWEADHHSEPFNYSVAILEFGNAIEFKILE